MTGQYVYNVCDFGARGDGRTKATAAIQQAIDECHKNGGGLVLLPAGTYLSAPLYLRSNVNFHLTAGAVLLGSGDLDDYRDWESVKINTRLAPYNCKYLILAEDEKNIALTGQGIINGQGLIHYNQSQATGQFWTVRNREQRPGRMIMFALCKNVLVEGLTFLDSPAWTFWAIGCDTVKFDKINIINDYRAINTDGIDIDCCRNATVSNAYIHSGDDCIVFRAIDAVLPEKKACEQAVVTNCTLESNCQAIRFSYIGDGAIRNIALSNLTIAKSTRGIILQIPARRQTPRHDQERAAQLDLDKRSSEPIVENIAFANIIVEANQPLWLFLDDDAKAARLANISFADMQLTGPSASVIKGNARTAFENVRFDNILATVTDGEPIASDRPAMAFFCSMCRDLSFRNVAIQGDNGRKDKNLPVFCCEATADLEMAGIKNKTGHALRLEAATPPGTKT